MHLLVHRRQRPFRLDTSRLYYTGGYSRRWNITSSESYRLYSGSMDGRSLAIIENYMKGDVLIRSQVLKGCQRTAVNLLYYPYGSSELQRILRRGDKLVPHRLWMQSGHRVISGSFFNRDYRLSLYFRPLLDVRSDDDRFMISIPD